MLLLPPGKKRAINNKNDILSFEILLAAVFKLSRYVQGTHDLWRDGFIYSFLNQKLPWEAVCQRRLQLLAGHSVKVKITI